MQTTEFLQISGCDNENAWKGSHMEAESEPPQQSEMLSAHPARLHSSEWIWRPWYAKLWWATIPIYWGGRWASLKVPALMSLYDTLPANYLALLCNPFILLLILGAGFVRAKLDCGDWIITSGQVIGERPIHIGRRPGELLDPYTDFTDPRSGIRYLEHRGLLHDHDH